ncbi:hypothetical protein ACJX0J_031472, partial [Zea mays]
CRWPPLFLSPRPRQGRASPASVGLSMPSTDLRRLTARIVDLPPGSPRSWRTWKQLRGGGFRNTIGMNVVLEACVRCGDVDRALRLFEEIRGPRGCGVDGVLRHPAQVSLLLLKFAAKVESLYGYTNSLLRPCIFPQV